MPRLDRRTFMGGAAAGLAATVVGVGRSEAGDSARVEPTQPVPFSKLADASVVAAGTQYLRWLRKYGVAKERDVLNLVWNFYDTQKKRGELIYPMLSGKAILWLLQRGNVSEATAIATTLIRWQQTSKTGALAKSYGAFPSFVEPSNGGWKLGERFYSGDNLMILEALVALYERTKSAALLNAAIGVGTWLTDVMCAGKRAGLWVDDHGAPMQFVTAKGDFSNLIHGSVEMLWIGSLTRLAKVTSEKAYSSQAERAFRFYLGAQAANGAFMDHYDPGYPAQRYSAARWKPYQPGRVLSDNALRSALGACRMGEIDRAKKFYRWLKVENGGIPAALDTRTGGAGFPPGQAVYYDVTSTGLHRSLCQWLGERKAAKADIDFLNRTRSPTGNWVWGIFRGSLLPVQPKLAPVAGFWATADLSVRVA